MRSWYETYVVGQQRVSAAMRRAEEHRRAASARRGRGERAGESLRVALRTTSRATVVLRRGDVVSLKVRARPYRITSEAGRLWVTGERSLQDRVLEAGQSELFEDWGKVVIEALGVATVTIECPRPLRVLLGGSPQPALQVW